MEYLSCQSAGIICQLLGVEMVDVKVQSSGSLAGSQSLVDMYLSPLFHKAMQK